MKCLAAALTFIFLLSLSVFSQTNEDLMLDSSFGRNGKVLTKNKLSEVKSVLLQKDGKIIAAGDAGAYDSSRNFSLVRYLNDGSIDKTYGDNGFVYTDFNKESDRLLVAKIQSTDKVIALGYATTFHLNRYNKDGSFDSTFSKKGIITLPDDSRGLGIQADDKIIVCTQRFFNGANTLFVRRFSKDGFVDSAFGNNGITIIPLKRQQLRSLKPVVAFDNKKRIIIGTTCAPTGLRIDDFIVIRLKNNGVIDSSFNKTGINGVDYNHDQNFVNAIAIQPNNKIILAGGTYSDLGGNFMTVRFNEDGTVDKNFGGNGIVITDFNTPYDNQIYTREDAITGLAIEQDGKIIATGYSYAFLSGRGRFAACRYLNDGHLDTSFGFKGRTFTKFTRGDARANSAVMQTDGKIIAAGYAIKRLHDAGSDGDYFAIARYLQDKEDGNQISHPVNNKPQTSKSYSLFPNPAKDVLNISGLSSSQKSIINIINSNGNIMKTATTSSSSYNINVSQLKSGLYNAQIIINGETQTLSFVKE